MDAFLTHAGYAAIILLGFLEACCIPIPSEITFGFGGVLAYQGHLSLAFVIILGTLAEVAGSYVSYGVGRVAERPLIEKFGRYLLISRADIDRAERFLAGRGAWAIPLGRTLPFVRSFTSVVAGLTGVSRTSLRDPQPDRYGDLRDHHRQRRIRGRVGMAHR